MYFVKTFCILRPDKEIQIRKVVMPIARLAKRSLIIFEGPEIRDNTVLTLPKSSHLSNSV